VRIDLIEKLVLFLAGLAVLAVAGFVTFCSMLPGGLRSGIPKVVEVSALNTQDWLNAQRRRSGRGAAGPVTLAPGEVMYQATPAPAGGGGGASGGGDDAGSPATPTAYFEASGNVPQAEQVPGFPWLRRVPGVNYASPQQVPDVLYRKYQSFEETWDLVQEGGGKFVKTNDGLRERPARRPEPRRRQGHVRTAQGRAALRRAHRARRLAHGPVVLRAVT
jgi:hypothetical protein